MTHPQSHCHWTYRIEGYQSFLNWPTRQAVEDELVGHPHPDRIEIYQTHGVGCPIPGIDHE